MLWRADHSFGGVDLSLIDHNGAQGVSMVVRRRAPTTHTVEMAQIKEINAKLQRASGAVIVAGELQLAPEPGERFEPVDPAAVLSRLSWTGSPSFPDVSAHFTAPDGRESRRGVRLHTAALKQISHQLGLHHAWGVRPPGHFHRVHRRRRSRSS